MLNIAALQHRIGIRIREQYFSRKSARDSEIHFTWRYLYEFVHLIVFSPLYHLVTNSTYLDQGYHLEGGNDTGGGVEGRILMNAETASEAERLLKEEEYVSSLFVDRESELRLVEERVEQGQSGIDIYRPLISFWGVAGIGKTWLLRHIHERYRFNPESEDKTPTCAIYYDFAKDEKKELLSFSAFVRALAETFLEELQGQLLSKEEFSNLAQAAESGEAEKLSSVIAALTDDCLPLLLLDTTENLDADFWQELEQELLEPVLETDRVIVIISGRRRVPRWRRVEVRRRAVPASESQVKLFEQKTLQKQFEVRGFPAPEQLAKRLLIVTAGNPRLATIIGTYFKNLLDGLESDALQAISLKEHVPVLKILRAYQEDVFKGVPKKLRFYIEEVLAPLRFYRTEAFSYMLLEQSIKREQHDDIQLLRILRQLEGETDIVWWDDSKNGYITAPVVRRVLDERLRLEKHTKFIRMHGQAVTLYSRWAEKYPDNKAVYLAELCFHQVMIDRAQQFPLDKVTGFEQMLVAIQSEIQEPARFDRLLILLHKVKEDAELKSLLPESVYQGMVKQLEALFEP